MSVVTSFDPIIEQEGLMVVPKQTKQLIKQFEGLKLKTYKDVAGKLTIGYGHYNATPPSCVDCMVITEQQAESMLDNDLEHILSQIQGHISVDLTDNQLAALISFAFNEGPHALISSTLLKKVNSGDFDQAAFQFLNWDFAGGVEVKGLLNRRTAEQRLFLTPDTEGETDVARN